MGQALRALAEHQGFQIGACANARMLSADPAYAAALGREFNSLTPENALKFGVLSPAPGVYDFTDADAVVAFAERHAMAIRGHVLVWHMQLPRWLAQAKPDRAELTATLVEHIGAVVGRYAGRISAWDVVNEAVAPDGRPRNSLWRRVIGPDYVRIAFEAARRADPQARLFYNDFGLEASAAHADAADALVARLRNEAPLDGVGLQMHLRVDNGRWLDLLQARMGRLAAMGLQVDVTELDVRVPAAPEPSAADLKQQAETYGKIVRLCLELPQCSSLTVWGVTDKYSWVPHFFPGEGAALLLDNKYAIKQAYNAVASELRRKTAGQEIA